MATLEDLEALLEDIDGKIDLLTTAVNAPKSLQRFCRHCHGTGNKIDGQPPNEPGTCPNCGGDGIKSIGRITLTSEE